MPRFTVLRTVDAYVTYTTEVEAATALEATALAQQNEDICIWAEYDTNTFDARSFEAMDEDGMVIPGTHRGDL